MENRRIRKLPKWVGWFGDMNNVHRFLGDKDWLSPWVVTKFIVAVFSGIGAVVFVFNPFSGFLLLAGIFLGDINVGSACLLAAGISVMFSKIIGRDDREVRLGITTLNNVLLGSLAAALTPGIINKQLDCTFWISLALVLVFSSYVDYGLSAIMAPCKLPVLSIPFNVMAVIFFFGMRSKEVGLHMNACSFHSTSYNTSSTVNSTGDVQWIRLFEGTVLSAGQIFGVGKMNSSLLMWLGFFLCSPLLTFFSYFGSVIGCLIGVLLNPNALHEVYEGLWGYNALLTAGCLCYFLNPTPSFVWTVFVGSSLTALLQAATTPLFLQNSIPILSYPFNIVSLIVLAIATTENSQINFVLTKSFPELHLYEHYFLSKEKKKKVGVNIYDVENPLRLEFIE